MDDKRQLANEQLQETLDSGILSLAGPQPQNFVELPESSQAAVSAEGGNVTNNFNVSVNVNGGSSKSIQSATSSAIQNAIPNMSGSADEIKKNSSLDFLGNSEEESNFLDVNYGEVPDLGVSNASDMLYLNLTEFQTPEVAHYTYSTSTMKENNNKINNEYEVLKNVIYSSTENQNITNVSPYSATDASFYIDQSMDTNRIETINRLTVDGGDNYEMMQETSKRRDRLQQQNMTELNKTLRNVQDISNLNESEIDDVQEATTIGRKYGAGVAGASPFQNQSMVSKPPEHINTAAPLNDIPTFIEKMNRPPIWRSVLG